MNICHRGLSCGVKLQQVTKLLKGSTGLNPGIQLARCVSTDGATDQKVHRLKDAEPFKVRFKYTSL